MVPAVGLYGSVRCGMTRIRARYARMRPSLAAHYRVMKEWVEIIDKYLSRFWQEVKIVIDVTRTCAGCTSAVTETNSQIEKAKPIWRLKIALGDR
jgi:hypothetical protein